MKNLSYSEKLKDPRWQKKRLEILQRDNFTCAFCTDTKTTLHVHHVSYNGNPWDATPDQLITVCSHCHQLIEQFKVSNLTLTSVSKFFSGNNVTLILATAYESNGYFYIVDVVEDSVAIKYCLPIKDVIKFIQS